MSLVCWFDVYPIPWSKYRGGQMKIYDHLIDRIIITICIWGEWECPLITPPPPHRGRCPILAYHSKGFSFNSVSKYYKATSWAEFRKFSRGWGGRGIRFGWDCLFFGNVNLIAWIFLGGGGISIVDHDQRQAWDGLAAMHDILVDTLPIILSIQLQFLY